MFIENLKKDINICISSKSKNVAVGLGFVLIIIVLTKSLIMQFQNDSLLNPEIPQTYLQYYPLSVYNSYIGINNQCFETDFFFIILPLLCSLPFSIDYKKCNDNNLIKINEFREFCCFYISKAFISVASGAIMTLLLLFSSFVLTSMFIPLVKPELLTGYFPATFGTFKEMYISTPWLYVFLYTLIASVFGGIYAGLSFTFSHFCKYEISAVCSSEILCLILMYFTKYLGGNEYLPVYFLKQSQDKYILNMKIVILEIVVCICFILIVNICFLFRVKTKWSAKT